MVDKIALVSLRAGFPLLLMVILLSTVTYSVGKVHAVTTPPQKKKKIQWHENTVEDVWDCAFYF